MDDTLNIKILRLHEAAKVPAYSHGGAYGDLAADLYSVENVDLLPGIIRAVKTGIAIEMPLGFGALVEDRSGLALKGLTTLGGVVDPGYRGELRVIVVNLGSEALKVSVGDRLAQLRPVKYFEARFEEVNSLSATDRNESGFGSSGT